MHSAKVELIIVWGKVNYGRSQWYRTNMRATEQQQQPFSCFLTQPHSPVEANCRQNASNTFGNYRFGKQRRGGKWVSSLLCRGVKSLVGHVWWQRKKNAKRGTLSLPKSRQQRKSRLKSPEVRAETDSSGENGLLCRVNESMCRRLQWKAIVPVQRKVETAFVMRCGNFSCTRSGQKRKKEKKKLSWAQRYASFSSHTPRHESPCLHSLHSAPWPGKPLVSAASAGDDSNLVLHLGFAQGQPSVDHILQSHTRALQGMNLVALPLLEKQCRLILGTTGGLLCHSNWPLRIM